MLDFSSPSDIPFDRSAPSARTPDLPTWLNTADNISRSLQEDNHRIWGFVIYRTTYTSDSDWSTFMSYLNHSIRSILSYDNGLDLLSSMHLTVFSDPVLYDGVTTYAIRDAFAKWAKTAPGEEQGEGMEGKWGLSQRYRYCIMVDEQAMRSVLAAGPNPGMYSGAWMRLVWRDWDPIPLVRRIGGRLVEEQMEEEEIEGCWREDVGWMKVEYQDVAVGMYYRLRDLSGDWHREYRRPPEVARA